MGAILKIHYWIYMRQTAAKEVAASVTPPADLISNVIGASPYQGESGAAADVNKWALVGEKATGALKAIETGAFFKGEKGDQQLLAGGENPVISEKALSEFASFDVDNAAWETAATSGAFGAMPIRKRYSTNVTGKNVDLAFIDVRSPLLVSPGITQNLFMWDVPCHVGLEAVAGALAKLPVTIEREVSDLNDHIDIFPCVGA